LAQGFIISGDITRNATHFLIEPTLLEIPCSLAEIFQGVKSH
jgi:hypothetical protein